MSTTSFGHAPLTLSYHLFQGTQGPKGNTGPPGANGQAVSHVLQFINFTLKIRLAVRGSYLRVLYYFRLQLNKMH